MTAFLLDRFPPLQGTIAQAENWTQYLNFRQAELGNRGPEQIAGSLESIVEIGILLGELLPWTWRLTFDNLFRPGEVSWSTIKEFEAARREVYRLFFTAREALDKTRKVSETLQGLTGRKPAGLDRLLRVIEEARRLEEVVFRDWPSFTEPLPAVNLANSLPVEESLAEALGTSVEEARRRMETRRRELKAGE